VQLHYEMFLDTMFHFELIGQNLEHLIHKRLFK